MNKDEFINLIGNEAVRVNRTLDKHLLPSICVAQACLESNYGGSSLMMRYYAPFGIKANKNTITKYTATTGEYYNGKNIRIIDSFRAYSSFHEAVLDYYKLITTSKYYKSAVNESDYKKAVLGLSAYATDPNYITKLLNIIESNNLTRFDNLTIFDNSNKTINTILLYEICMNQYGNGEERKNKLESLGYDYNEVQTAVNNFIKIVNDTKLGKYGNGEERKNKLGEKYKFVQDLINRNVNF